MSQPPYGWPLGACGRTAGSVGAVWRVCGRSRCVLVQLPTGQLEHLIVAQAVQQPVDVEGVKHQPRVVKQAVRAVALHDVCTVASVLGRAQQQARAAVVVAVPAARAMPARADCLPAAFAQQQGRHRVCGVPALLGLGGWNEYGKPLICAEM